DYSVVGSLGCGASGTVIIGVFDDQLPEIECPPPLTINTDLGDCFALNPFLGIPITSDNCLVDTVFNNFALLFPDGQVPTGTHTITWTVVDWQGNSASCTQSLTVADNEPPIISCQGISVVAGTGGCSIFVNIPLPLVSDNCGVLSVTNSYNNGDDASDTYSLGINNVIWTVVDINGNVNYCQFEVYVSSILIAVNDTATTMDDTPVDIFILGNDQYCETDDGSVSVTIISPPFYGMTMLSGDGKYMTYYPDNDFFGIDSLEYELCDVTGACDTATVYIYVIYVNNPPVAIDDYDTITKNMPRIIDVLANDYDTDGYIVDIKILNHPLQGTAKIMADKTVLYSPFNDYLGFDNFDYMIYDDGNPSLSDTASVFLLTIEDDIFSELPFLIYNALTPNADGKNDYWKIKGIELFPDDIIIIMDRWGEIIAEIENYDKAANRWEGKNKMGEMMPNGTYYYFIKLSMYDTLYKGWVLLYTDE
ncbi:MAG: gliding motility-associated C-terminal domain-containing protein, partial [Bacteroidales bacterium]|nr:gliding motility-associated C-terminal domain-containing protein [Bacteroidales bacterium]